MSTYRKFDKYRQRADFASDIEFGIDSPANKWISTGTGTPVYTAASTGGFVLGTSAGANDTSYIQRGIVSAATKAAPVLPRQGLKFHAVATLDASLLSDTGGVFLGFAAANANPAGQNRVSLRYDGANGLWIAEAGLNASIKSAQREALIADSVRDSLLDLEVYYDGTDHVQFFAGRSRILKVDVEFGANGFMESLSGGLSPTLGLTNGGTAEAQTSIVTCFGWAEQRVPART